MSFNDTNKEAIRTSFISPSFHLSNELILFNDAITKNSQKSCILQLYVLIERIFSKLKF